MLKSQPTNNIERKKKANPKLHRRLLVGYEGQKKCEKTS